MCYNEDGKPVNGKFSTHYQNGIVEREGFAVKGKPYGEMKVHNTKGEVVLISNFKKGKPHGLMLHYSHGRLMRTEKYRNGKFVREIKVKK
jgi:antitoxin component YwqK of YwqJK toxin-antitoxin module